MYNTINPTREEYNKVYNRISKYKEYSNSLLDIDILVKQTFFRVSEQSRKIINNRTIRKPMDTEGKLPNGNLLCWEIQIIACHHSNNDISKFHMEKWNTPQIHNEIKNIIGSKRL